VKRLCIFSPSAYPLLSRDKIAISAGGAEAQLSTLGVCLADQGYEVHYIVGDFGQPQSEVLGNVRVHKAPLRYMGGGNKYLLSDWVHLFRVLWQINADLHVIKLPRHLLALLGGYCKLRNRRLIFVGQIDNDVDLEYIRAYEGRLTYWMYRFGIKLVDYVVAQNELQREGFERLFGKKTNVVKSMVTLPSMADAVKSNYVLWVGSSLEKKQPQVFLELARALPEIKFRIIVAPANQKLNDLLKDQAEHIPNLEFIGFVPLSEISVHFSEASLFVSTSLREGFPNTFLQSWQYGVPVISLNVDPDDVIKKFKLGYLSRSFEKLCQDVQCIMNDEDARLDCGRNAKQYILKHHSKEVIVAQYMDIFENL